MLNRLKTCISCGTQALMADAPHCEACWSTEWRFRCTLHDVECVGTACPQCSYVFDGKPYSNSVSLAEAFTRNWSHAAAALRASPCSAWVRASLSDEHTARLIQDIEIERLLSDDELVSLVSWTLDSSRGITWRGTNVSHRKAALGLRDWLDLLESTVPKHCAGSPPMVWLADLADDWSLARRNCRDHAPAMFATTPRLGCWPAS